MWTCGILHYWELGNANTDIESCSTSSIPQAAAGKLT